MKNLKISIQNGLNDIKERLIQEGHEVHSFEEIGMKADVVVITGVDSAYEEIETAQCRLSTDGVEVLLINASDLTPEQVVNYLNSHCCNC